MTVENTMPEGAAARAQHIAKSLSDALTIVREHLELSSERDRRLILESLLPAGSRVSVSNGAKPQLGLV